MAINKEVFRVRALSSLVFVIVMLVGLLWSKWSFLILFSIIHFGCWREYIRLIEKIAAASFHRFIQYGFMLTGYALMLSFCGKIYNINGYGLKENICLPLSLAGFIIIVAGIFQKGNVFSLKTFAAAALGWLYISLSWGMMVGISQQELKIAIAGEQTINRIIPIILIIAIWGNDTFAYLVGSFIGKTPFSKISPKKTWEGTLGGAIICVVAISFIMSYFVFVQFRDSNDVITWKNFWGPTAAIAAVIGTTGDLLESKLKRMAGVKDSGTMLPGHGGFLDRFDSLLLATPFVWLLVKLVME